MNQLGQLDRRNVHGVWTLARAGTKFLVFEDVAGARALWVADAVTEFHGTGHDDLAFFFVNNWHR